MEHKSELMRRAQAAANAQGLKGDTAAWFMIGYVDEFLSMRERISRAGEAAARQEKLICSRCGETYAGFHACAPRKENKLCLSKQKSELVN